MHCYTPRRANDGLFKQLLWHTGEKYNSSDQIKSTQPKKLTSL